MTETEWLACNDPDRMLEHLGDRDPRYGYFRHPVPDLSDGLSRRLRLFACACLRRIWHLLTSRHSRWAVEMAERFADKQVGSFRLLAAGLATMFNRPKSPNSLPGYPASVAGLEWAMPRWHAAPCATLTAEALSQTTTGDPTASFAAERATQAHLVRDIFGNPFAPATLNPIWITRTVGNVARSAYKDRALPSGHLGPAHLSVLSDALEEAGCTATDLLSHLRSPGPHVRGCWAVDLILGKS